MLLVQRGKPLGFRRWSLPGGKLEASETSLDAAIRELWEETQVVAHLLHAVGEFVVEGPDARFVIDCFTGDYVSGMATAGDDAMAVAWVNHAAIQTYDLAPNIAEAVFMARDLIKL